MHQWQAELEDDDELALPMMPSLHKEDDLHTWEETKDEDDGPRRTTTYTERFLPRHPWLRIVQDEEVGEGGEGDGDGAGRPSAGRAEGRPEGRPTARRQERPPGWRRRRRSWRWWHWRRWYRWRWLL